MQYTHKSCGHKMTLRLVCSECHETLHVNEVKAELTRDDYEYREHHKRSS